MGSVEDIRREGNATIRGAFLFAINRTCSHVLCRLLSDQPGWRQSNYHFKRALDFARDSFNWGPLADVSVEQRLGLEKLLQEGFDEIQSERKCAAKEDEVLFLKEHTFYIWEPSKLSQSMWGGSSDNLPFTVLEEGSLLPSDCPKTNSTIFSDDFLLSWRPIFLIRNPVLTFESWYRAESGARDLDLTDRSFAFFTTFQYSRQLYDWYLSKRTDAASAPIVIDADDFLDDDSTIRKLCSLLGMDPDRILYKWDVIQAPENAGRRELKFMSGYWNSTSVDRSKSSRGLDMAATYARWREDFGPGSANELQKIVEQSMPDYNYMKSKKI